MVDYNLQQSPLSQQQTLDVLERTEWAPGLQMVGEVVGKLGAGYVRGVQQGQQDQQRLQKTLDESAYEKEIDSIIRRSETDTSFKGSKMQDAIREVDDRFLHVDPDTRYRIRKNKGIGTPYNVAFETEQLTRQETAKRQAEEDQLYIDTALAFRGPSAASLPSEDNIRFGKALVNGQNLNASVARYASSENTQEGLLNTALQIPAYSTAEVFREAARQQVTAKGNIDAVWLEQNTQQAFEQLIREGLNERQALAAVNAASAPWKKAVDYLAKNKDEADKVLENDNKRKEERFAAAFFNEFGYPLSLQKSLFEALQYLGEEQIQQVLKAFPGMVKIADKMKKDIANTPITPVYTTVNAVVSSPETTRAQKTAAVSYLEAALTNEIVKNSNELLSVSSSALLASPEELQTNPMYSEELSKYLEANSQNFKYFLDTAFAGAAEVEQYLKTADPEDIKNTRQNAMDYLEGALNNEFAKIALDTVGHLKLTDEGLVSDNAEDNASLTEFNSQLRFLKRISEEAPTYLPPKEINNMLKQLTSYYSLATERERSAAQWAAIILNPLTTMLGAATGNRNARALWMKPRDAVRAEGYVSRMEQATGDTSTLSEALTEWSIAGAARAGFKRIADPLSEMVNEGGKAFVKGYRAANNYLSSSEDTKERIKKEEGFLARVEDGNIGYGFNLKAIRNMAPEVKSKLEAVAPGITSEEYEKSYQGNTQNFLGILKANQIFDILYEEAEKDAQQFAGNNWNSLSEARKQVLIDMAYNMGRTSLNSFKETRKAIQEGDYKKAAKEILDSKYGKTLKNRARRNASLMETGSF